MLVIMEREIQQHAKTNRTANELASVQDVADWVDCPSDGHLRPLPDQRGGLHPSFGGAYQYKGVAAYGCLRDV